MDLYADNLSSLRRKQPDHRFSLTTTALLAIQTIRSVKEVHDRGYLHRDIKPVSL
jgi:serine/threonine protein kinase